MEPYKGRVWQNALSKSKNKVKLNRVHRERNVKFLLWRFILITEQFYLTIILEFFFKQVYSVTCTASCWTNTLKLNDAAVMTWQLAALKRWIQNRSVRLTRARFRNEKHSMSSMWTSSMKRTPGAISAFPSSRHSDTLALIWNKAEVMTLAQVVERSLIIKHGWNWVCRPKKRTQTNLHGIFDWNGTVGPLSSALSILSKYGRNWIIWPSKWNKTELDFWAEQNQRPAQFRSCLLIIGLNLTIGKILYWCQYRPTNKRDLEFTYKQQYKL